MAEKEDKYRVPASPKDPGEVRKQQHRIDHADTDPDVMYSSSLPVPPGKVVTESYKEENKKHNK